MTGFEVSNEQKHGKIGPAIVWLTGLSGAGKTTTANALHSLLQNNKQLSTIVDGDELRRGLSRDLGFDDAARVENIRRASEVAKILANTGFLTIVSLISPFRADRSQARHIAGHIRFVEVFIDAPLPICEQRDPKGLYRKARAGLIPNFTGITSPYEPPDVPDIHLRTDRISPQESAILIAESLGLSKIDATQESSELSHWAPNLLINQQR